MVGFNTALLVAGQISNMKRALRLRRLKKEYMKKVGKRMSSIMSANHLKSFIKNNANSYLDESG